MSVESIGGVAGLPDLSALAETFRSQVRGTSGADAATGGLDALAGSSGLDGLAASQAQAVRGTDFAAMLGNGVTSLEAMDADAQVKAVKAATGDLQDVHDYSIAATQVSVATDLTTTIRNKALEAFNDIMRMPL